MSDSEEFEKLNRYRDEVVREIHIRTDRVRVCDQQIDLHTRQTEKGGAQRTGMVELTEKAMAQEAYRKRLHKKLQGLRREKDEAMRDLEKAQERLLLVEEELRGLSEDPFEADYEK